MKDTGLLECSSRADMMPVVPLDHPTPDRDHRVYIALTNSCNRSCPWCSTCSSPAGDAWIAEETFLASLPKDREYQLQLEGGEPTIHPGFWSYVALAREDARCTHLVICTNGVVIPRDLRRMQAWIERLGEPLTLKVSINHHLIEHDPGHIEMTKMLRDLFEELGGCRLLVLNVRLRPGRDSWVREAVEDAGLMHCANIFQLQRYGFASGESTWNPPAPVWNAFTLVNPDGRTFGQDLIARSEGMRELS